MTITGMFVENAVFFVLPQSANGIKVRISAEKCSKVSHLDENYKSTWLIFLGLVWTLITLTPQFFTGDYF